MSTIRILGAGAWGTALALLWSQEQGEGRPAPVIELLARTADEAALLRSTRINTRRLPGVALPAAINIFSATDALTTLSADDTFVVTIPSTELDPDTAKQIVQAAGDAPMVIASKGLSLSGARPSELLIAAGADSERLSVLSGPNLASEIAMGKPAAAVLAGPAHLVESLLTIAVSGVRALGYGENAAAALLSRGVAEMARLAEACGGRTETACGLAGVGDLVVTSSNTGSRNAKLGALLASGMTVQAAVDKIGATVEGIGTAHGALQLAAAHKLEMPITAAVVAAISGGATIEVLARALLGRSPAGEWH
jgi:glycerol-3-phosphate dehydrogenase (NAD(P)+)